MNKKSGIIVFFAGILMIITSVVNYLLNDDYISLGIFLFAGIGFIMLGFDDKQDKNKSKRLQKYAGVFFAISLIIFMYWLLAGKLGII